MVFASRLVHVKRLISGKYNSNPADFEIVENWANATIWVYEMN